MAEDAGAVLVLLLLLPLEVVVGMGEDLVELLGESESVGGPLKAVDEEVVTVPRNVAEGVFVSGMLVFVRVGGIELFGRLHFGLPAASRKHVYPGAGSGRKQLSERQIRISR